MSTEIDTAISYTIKHAMCHFLIGGNTDSSDKKKIGWLRQPTDFIKSYDACYLMLGIELKITQLQQYYFQRYATLHCTFDKKNIDAILLLL